VERTEFGNARFRAFLDWCYAGSSILTTSNTKVKTTLLRISPLPKVSVHSQFLPIAAQSEIPLVIRYESTPIAENAEGDR
jgi:hypothetical protein